MPSSGKNSGPIVLINLNLSRVLNKRPSLLVIGRRSHTGLCIKHLCKLPSNSYTLSFICSGNLATVSIFSAEVTALVLTWISVPFYQMSLKYLHLRIPVPGLIFYPPCSSSFLQHHHSLHRQDTNLVYFRAPSPHPLFLISKSYWFLPTQNLSDVPLPLYSLGPHQTQASHCSSMI